MGYRSSQNSSKQIKFNTLCFIVLLCSFSQSVFSQARDSGSPKKSKNSSFELDRVVLGGSIGANFGDITIIDLSPTIGYLLTDEWLVGIGIRYAYYEDRSFNFKTNIYGANTFSQYYFLENFVAHVEFEVLNREIITVFGERERVTINSFFVGGGYRSQIGSNSAVSLLLLYNLNDDKYSPYPNPLLRVSFGIGL